MLSVKMLSVFDNLPFAEESAKIADSFDFNKNNDKILKKFLDDIIIYIKIASDKGKHSTIAPVRNIYGLKYNKEIVFKTIIDGLKLKKYNATFIDTETDNYTEFHISW